MKFTVTANQAGQRLDVILAKKYPQFSRSSLGVLFKDNLVNCSGKSLQPSAKLPAGSVIEIEDSILFRQPAIDLPVVYEDDDVIVIDKPAGVLTHSKGSLNLEGTVASFIAPKLSSGLSGNRAGIVHRLDRGTSGLIITAKNLASQKYLQKQFSEREVNKAYTAAIRGELECDKGVIDISIARNPKNPKSFIATQSGKLAQTAYKTLKTKNGYSLVELKPTTGRTHQLRVHLTYLKHPIVGDELYGGEPARRLMLHARELSLRLPDGQLKTFKSTLPVEFTHYE